MKEITQSQHSVVLLEGDTTLCDVIDSHIYEHILVRHTQTCFELQ